VLSHNLSTAQNVVWLLNGETVADNAFDLGVIAPRNARGRMAGVGDFDGDGQSDVLWRYWQTGEVDVQLLGARFTSRGGVLGASLDWQIQGIGDFDGDEKSDILWRNESTGDIGLWLMNGDAVSSYPIPARAIPAEWVIVATSDLDGDGKDDLVWRDTATGDVGAWLMNGGVARTMDTPWRGVPMQWKIAGSIADQTF